MRDDNENDSKSTFLNRRDWSSFVGALQDAATYPKLKYAVMTSRDWFTQGAAQASNWLGGSPELKGISSAG